MSVGPLSQRVNIRKAVTRNACYEGVLGAEQLPRFRDQLGDAQNSVRLRVQFGLDEESQQYIDVEMSASVTLECQRCLGAIRTQLNNTTQLGLVLTDEQARQLRRGYEPWIAEDEVDLWDIAAEELALALPVVAFHPDGECDGPGAAYLAGGPLAAGGMTDSETDSGDSATAASENPFSVLSTLLANSTSEEK